MTVTYNIGDRVKINWEACGGINLVAYALDRFQYGEIYVGTVEKVYNNIAIIIWDKPYHSAMYGRYGKQWNLRMEVLKLAKYHKELTPEERILLRIKKTYAKSKLPFVQNWSN